eukprot:6868564-Lingulodinium_polyedra.AAC.1
MESSQPRMFVRTVSANATCRARRRAPWWIPAQGPSAGSPTAGRPARPAHLARLRRPRPAQ